MTFIYGGAYQGQEEYACEHLGVRETVHMTETTEHFDGTKAAFCDLDSFVLGCVRRGQSAAKIFEEEYGLLKNAVFIGRDFSGGIVPMDAEMRFWREENGRLNSMIASKADCVIRMFCGIPQVLK